MTKSTNPGNVPDHLRIMTNGQGVFLHVGDLCDILACLAKEEQEENIAIVYEALAEALPKVILRCTWGPLYDVVDKEAPRAK